MRNPMNSISISIQVLLHLFLFIIQLPKIRGSTSTSSSSPSTSATTTTKATATETPSIVIGVDGGTESIRACCFDAKNGKTIGSSFAVPYTTTHPQPGWAEQNPHDWWNNLGLAVRGLWIRHNRVTRKILMPMMKMMPMMQMMQLSIRRKKIWI